MPALILFIVEGGGVLLRDIIVGGIAMGTADDQRLKSADDAITLKLDASDTDPGGTNVD